MEAKQIDQEMIRAQVMNEMIVDKEIKGFVIKVLGMIIIAVIVCLMMYNKVKLNSERDMRRIHEAIASTTNEKLKKYEAEIERLNEERQYELFERVNEAKNTLTTTQQKLVTVNEEKLKAHFETKLSEAKAESERQIAAVRFDCEAKIAQVEIQKRDEEIVELKRQNEESFDKIAALEKKVEELEKTNTKLTVSNKNLNYQNEVNAEALREINASKYKRLTASDRIANRHRSKVLNEQSTLNNFNKR